MPKGVGLYLYPGHCGTVDMLGYEEMKFSDKLTEDGSVQKSAVSVGLQTEHKKKDKTLGA